MTASEPALYAVWTKADHADWVEHNAGCRDVLITTSLPEKAAHALANRLRYVYRDQNLGVHPVDQPPVPS